MNEQTPKKNIIKLPHEIFHLVERARSRVKKVKLLQEEATFAVKSILQGAFRNDIIFDLPEGAPPFKADEYPAGKQPSPLNTVIKNAKALTTLRTDIPSVRKERIFTRMLETVFVEDAAILVAMKDKNLTEKYPTIDRDLVERALPDLFKGEKNPTTV